MSGRENWGILGHIIIHVVFVPSLCNPGQQEFACKSRILFDVKHQSFIFTYSFCTRQDCRTWYKLSQCVLIPVAYWNNSNIHVSGLSYLKPVTVCMESPLRLSENFPKIQKKNHDSSHQQCNLKCNGWGAQPEASLQEERVLWSIALAD